MTTAFTWGTFNSIHDGHRQFLLHVKKISDEVHVILIPNVEVLANKKYVALDWETRKANIAGLGIASHIHYDSYNLGLKSVLAFRPDFFVLGYDQRSVWEHRLRTFLTASGLTTKILYSKEFAGGIHCAQFRKRIQAEASLPISEITPTVTLFARS